MLAYWCWCWGTLCDDVCMLCFASFRFILLSSAYVRLILWCSHHLFAHEPSGVGSFPSSCRIMFLVRDMVIFCWSYNSFNDSILYLFCVSGWLTNFLKINNWMKMALVHYLLVSLSVRHAMHSKLPFSPWYWGFRAKWWVFALPSGHGIESSLVAAAVMVLLPTGHPAMQIVSMKC